MTKHFLRTCLSLVVCLALCLTMLVFSAGAVSQGAVTTRTAVNIRTGAGTSNSIIATVPAGTTLICGGSTNGWYKVVYNGTVGYVSGAYVTLGTTATGSFGTGTVVASAVNLRAGAGTNTAVVATLTKGTTMTVTGISGEWYQVNCNGKTGYVNSAYIGLSGSAAPAPSQNPTPAPATGTAGSVKGNSVRMRSGPGTNYSILGTYNNGTALTIVGTENGWTKVTLGGVTGYIRSDYVATGAAPTNPAAPTTGTGYINGTGVRMRAGASTTSQILGTYNTGTAMTITGSSGNWYAVTYNGRNGYVCKDYMTMTAPAGNTAPASGTAGTVKGNYVRLRSGAGTNYSILGTYNNGTPVTITGTNGSWTAVVINGKSGYMSSAYISVGAAPAANTGVQQTAPATNATGTATGAAIVETAKQYLGYPYVYGGMSPSGFDCSGFVNYVYKQHGYSMNRVASAIYYNNGTYVDKANLQPGDLVFFSNSSESVGHVGIYIGGNQFIHASTSRTGVIISDLTSSYYIQHYVGAKRIIT